MSDNFETAEEAEHSARVADAGAEFREALAGAGTPAFEVVGAIMCGPDEPSEADKAVVAEFAQELSDRVTEAVIESVWEHPQGGRITVFVDGSFQAFNAAGKRKPTSATPEKLRAGHGQWTRIS